MNREMPKVKSNNIEIFYETIGNPSDKPLLLIMGQGSQMIRWDDDFCQLLVEKGFYVIRFDNRDVGLSTKFDDFGVPKLWEAAIAINAGKNIEAPYTLEDIADDAIGLLDALNIKKAHICGISMGGMVAQVISYRHPSRIFSLISMISGTGKKGLPIPKPEVIKLFHKEAPSDPEGYINHMVALMHSLYGPGFCFNEEKVREKFQRCVKRSFYLPGFTRHYLAILINGDRTKNLASVKVPALIIHGRDDPLVRVELGIQTAEAIADSQLLIIDGMGHSLPPETWDQITDAIVTIAAKAQ